MGIEVQRAPARFIITIGWIKADAGLEFLGATDGVECPVNRGARFARECFREFRFAFFFVEEAQHKLVFRISDRKSTRLNSSHTVISYAVFCLKKKKID